MRLGKNSRLMMKDKRLYKQLQFLTNKELIFHAYRKDLYTDDVVEIANEILEEKTLTVDELAYKKQVLITYEDAQSKNNFSSGSNLRLQISILNNVVLISFLLQIIFWGFIIIPLEEQTILSFSLLTIIFFGLGFTIFSFIKNKMWAMKFLMIFNIPMTLIVGVQLLMMSLFLGVFIIALSTFGILAFIIINNYLIFNRKVQQSYKISNDFYTASMVLNILFGLALLCYLYVSLVTLY